MARRPRSDPRPTDADEYRLGVASKPLTFMSLVRLLLPFLLALLATTAIGRSLRRRNLVPPRLREPRESEDDFPQPAWEVALRRTLAAGVLSLVLYLGVLAPLGMIGNEAVLQPSDLHIWQLFVLHGLFAVALLAWYGVGFLPHRGVATTLWAQYGLRAANVMQELGLGAAAGVGIWFVVIALLLLLSFLMVLFGGLEALPREPPRTVIWIATLPFWVRVAVSLSAGFFEEIFFRGFLQPRTGIALSTALFSLAHLSYDQPFMLIGVTLLSLLFAWLVQWRQSIWAAVAAHAVFDMTQLLVVIPLLTGFLGEGPPQAT